MQLTEAPAVVSQSPTSYPTADLPLEYLDPQPHKSFCLSLHEEARGPKDSTVFVLFEMVRWKMPFLAFPAFRKTDAMSQQKPDLATRLLQSDNEIRPQRVGR